VTTESDVLSPEMLARLTPSMKRAMKWIDYSGPVGIVKPRVIRVRTNSKNQFNTVDPVYGCVGGLTNVDPATGVAYGCPWGCYAKFSFKKLRADFSTPVPQIVNEKILKEDLRKVRRRGVHWIRNGVVGDPSQDWETTIDCCEIEHRMDLTPVVFTRQWLDPSPSQVRELIDYDVLLHSTICALDSDGFLAPREEMVRTYLQEGGQAVLRVVTFHYDDTTEEGLRLWDRQDHLMSGAFGSVDALQPLILENPARLIRGKKQQNPTWKYLGEWAYHKAPTTRDHRFSPYNHNWTAGVLYEKDACWVGCRGCTVQCHTRNKQTSIDSFTREIR